MTILAAMQSAAVRLLGQRPAAFFGGAGTFPLEISELVNEVAQDIAKYQDWQSLVSTATITGDGTSTDFALPVDYDRMLVRSDVMDPATWFWGYNAFTDINAFLRAAEVATITPGGWIIYGDRLRFTSAPADGQVATFPYISKNWAITDGPTPAAAFAADGDSFVLPERLLTLGLIWRWRENKKLDASGDQEAFVKALDEYASKDRGSRIYRRKAARRFPGTYAAWPGVLGPATY